MLECATQTDTFMQLLNCLSLYKRPIKYGICNLLSGRNTVGLNSACWRLVTIFSERSKP